MKPHELQVGMKVRSNTEFWGVPKGTTGTIISEYNFGDLPEDEGVNVQWDLENRWKPLVDGFNKTTEAQYLDIVE
jgi:hypothetical protein